MAFGGSWNEEAEEARGALPSQKLNTEHKTFCEATWGHQSAPGYCSLRNYKAMPRSLRCCVHLHSYPRLDTRTVAYTGHCWMA